ncbi:ABC transporter substrate-binding protein [Cyanobacteria bacterium FACHB-502]|nr:ABC transporter substrate-binding protein [Leptolyngbya sp. FACHB-711]MBD1849541.1 ABC transporter substrate-binding protein [Cyanobacteria bacterium FACHB-502]MBD2024888.1 ABC transporter substrate-binding protein [Leptolyngbya sp. FACHB-711]
MRAGIISGISSEIAQLGRRFLAMRSRFPQGVIGLVLIMAIGLSSCNPSELRSQAASVPRLVISELSEPKTFNPVTSQETTSVFGLILDSLLSTNGLNGDLEPGLAESWEISPNQKQITFTLREGLKWSDSTPLTVDDVLFTFNDVLFNPKIPSSSADILRVGEQGKFPTVEKVDDRRVRFTVPEPFAPILRFAGGVEILPKHVLAESVSTLDGNNQPKFLSTWGTGTNPAEIVGSGAYKLTSYRVGERLIFDRNPNYWRKDAQGNPQPYIDQFVIQIVESTDAQLTQFRSGGLDTAAVTPDYFRLIKREENRGDFTIYEGGPALSSLFMAFNLNQGKRNGKPLVNPIKSRWFNTLEFRQAVAQAIDRPTMINNIYQGLGVPQNSPIYIQSPYYLPPEKGLPTYEYNIEQAKALLQRAGFKYNAQGQLLDADGNRVRFTMSTNAGNKIREASGSQIKQDLSKIGIQVDFQPVAFNTLVGQMTDSLDWDTMIMGLGGAGIEPDGGRNVWSPDGQLHLFNQKPGEGKTPLEERVVADWEAEIGQLYVKGSQELNDDKRKAIYAEIQKLVQQYVPMVYLVNPLALSAVRNEIEGVKFSALGGSLWNLHELKLSEE